MGIGINRLTALQVQRLKQPGYHADGAGLYLCVKPSGAKSWIFRYRFAGREREMGLGSLVTFGLADARERALAQRRLLADGKDPLDIKHAAQAQQRQSRADVLAFDAAAARYIASHRAGWKNAKHAEQWTNTLATYASPVLGALAVSEIQTHHVMRVLEPIWVDKTETASRLRGRLERVLDWCKVQGYRTGDNPAAWRGHLENLLSAPKKTMVVKHHAALPWREIAAFMAELRQKPGMAALLTEWIILTNCRTEEGLKARWEEIDLERAVWTVPANRMKAKKEHLIPLSQHALSVLHKVRAVVEPVGYVFPKPPNKNSLLEQPLSNAACMALLKRMGHADLTVHGFRSSFRDWAGESTSHPREVIEHAMAHQLQDKAEAAYARGTLLERRRVLMADWGRHCSGGVLCH